MERAERLLDKMAARSLYVRTDFEAGGRRGCLLATTDLSDHNALLECLRALREAGKKITGYDVLQTKVLTTFERTFVETEEEALGYLLSGDGLIFLDGEPGCIRLAVRKYETRAVSEPPTEGIVKGPREGFVENIKTNLSMIERKLRTPDLKVERLKIGRRTMTDAAILSLSSAKRLPK